VELSPYLNGLQASHSFIRDVTFTDGYVKLNVSWNVHRDINFEAITNLRHKYLYSYNITILYMFRTILCSSSGGSIVYVQHLVPSLSVSGRTLHWLTSVTYRRSLRVTVPGAVHIQLNLLKMSIIMLETCRRL